MPILLRKAGDADRSPPTPRGSRRASHGTGAGGPDGPGGLGWRIIGLVALLLLVNYMVAAAISPGEERREVAYEPTFLEQVEAGNVPSIRSEGRTITGTFEDAVDPAEGGDQVTRFRTEVPPFADEERLQRALERNDVVINAREEGDDGGGWLWLLLLAFGPIVLLVGLFVWFARRAGGAMGGAGGSPLGGFGKSRARKVEPTAQKVSFDDVAGIDESKAELEEIVDFLREPGRYRKLGGRVPRGVLLCGPPGTGKTLLARAVAGEAEAPFFSISASEFVEAVVGVGASRVRDMFTQARECGRAIIFIDELDAVGRKRSGGGQISGGNDEREQTLNQILTEMDGFEHHESVIVLAATNRPDDLDEALLRPGRFDRRVVVAPPDKAGRQQILGVHTRSLPLADDVDLEAVAQMTPGMVGADLANLCNEAALLAARQRRDEVGMAHFHEALEKVALGTPRNMLLSEDDRRLTAYHEAGHALVGMLTPGADPVRKVSIMPRGRALGVTLAAPDQDRVNYRRGELLARMRVTLGGRVAEELACDDITTGAEDDLEQLTMIARQMVGRWGMSDRIGPISLLPREQQVPYGDGKADDTRRRVDAEAEQLVARLHDEVRALLAEHREQLDALSAALLEEETLDEEQAYRAAGMTPSGGGDEASSRNGDGPQAIDMPGATPTSTSRGTEAPSASASASRSSSRPPTRRDSTP